MREPSRPDLAPARSPQFLPTFAGILLAIAPLGLFPLLDIDPLDPTPEARVGIFALAVLFPGWVATTALRSRSVGPVIVVAALVPAASLGYLLLSSGTAAADAAGDLDAFLALALPPALLGAIGYGLIELAVATTQRIDPGGVASSRRTVLAGLAGFVVSGAMVGVIGWLTFGVVGFRLAA